MVRKVLQAQVSTDFGLWEIRRTAELLHQELKEVNGLDVHHYVEGLCELVLPEFPVEWNYWGEEDADDESVSMRQTPCRCSSLLQTVTLVQRQIAEGHSPRDLDCVFGYPLEVAATYGYQPIVELIFPMMPDCPLQKGLDFMFALLMEEGVETGDKEPRRLHKCDREKIERMACRI